MLPQDVTDRVETHLGTTVREALSVGGGCIANATRIRTDSGDFFVKWSRDEAAAAFQAEAAGLAAMRNSGSSLIIPEPLLAESGTGDAAGVLLLNWIETGDKGSRFWERFGEGLAEMHAHTAGHFGFDTDNFIGRLPQDNTWETSWTDFFRSRRIEPQVELARRRGRWHASWNGALEHLMDRLPELLPADPEPSILHGDLWSGNFMVDAKGDPVLIDPASYHGHREADLAMTELFGGFERRFYEAYNGRWPLSPGYDERREIYNLYHLLNHLNHFGGGYAGSVSSILKKF